MSGFAGEADVIVVGGGPAGLSAALLLGRCRRDVLLFDTNLPRNRASRAVHGFLSRDGTPPAEFRRIALHQLRPYRSVSYRIGKIVAARRAAGGFTVEHENGERFHGRKLLLATGVKDVLPDLPGLNRFYGRSAFHCPVCDGWEQRDKPLVVWGRGKTACAYVKEVLSWSRDVTLCTGGPSEMTAKQLKQLKALEIRVIESKVKRLSGLGRQLRQIRFEGETKIVCHALFFCSEEKPQSDLAFQLGAATTPDGRVRTNSDERTRVPGLYVAGNSSTGVQLVIIAAAEGAKAAYAINEELNQENLVSFKCG